MDIGCTVVIGFLTATQRRTGSAQTIASVGRPAQHAHVQCRPGAKVALFTLPNVSWMPTWPAGTTATHLLAAIAVATSPTPMGRAYFCTVEIRVEAMATKGDQWLRVRLLDWVGCGVWCVV